MIGDDSEEMLDIGKQLKEEKKRKENQQKVEQLKKEYKEEQKNEEKKEKEIAEENKEGKYTIIFVIILLLTTILLRTYVADKSITETWAEKVVSQNLKVQVQNKIAEEYPTLSDAKKQELTAEGVKEALFAPQNQQAIIKLAEAYKESYKDQEGVSYLEEIDPYTFYGQSQRTDLILNPTMHNFLPFFEQNFFKGVSFFFPTVSFIRTIAYIPLLFTILCVFLIFYLGIILWNEEAGFIAALLFTLHPIILEFSRIGLTDTNMLNMFFILGSGVLFLYGFLVIREKQQYSLGIFACVSLIGLLYVFRYTWSAWYIAAVLILLTGSIFFGMRWIQFLFSWKEQFAVKKRIMTASVVLIIGLVIGFYLYAVQIDPLDNTMNIEKYVPENLAKYLHFSDQDSVWPDGFSLIKELQNTSLTDMINYLGGAVYLLISLVVFVFLLSRSWKKNCLEGWYCLGGYVIFLLLSFRAVRLVPYFIPFFALTVGIGVTESMRYVRKKCEEILHGEKKQFQQLSVMLFYVIITVILLYPLVPVIKEKATIMPIMDDAIYNSALFLRQTTNQSAVISTWWDRGAFYTALAQRTVHLVSQPYMPRTYWLASFYMSADEIAARNIMKLLNCYGEEELSRQLNAFYNPKESMNIIKNVLLLEEEKQEPYINSIFSSFNYSLTQDDTTANIFFSNLFKSKINCDASTAETYIVVMDDLMPRFSAVEYFAAWNFALQEADPTFPYIDLAETGCERTQSGAYCNVNGGTLFLNFTTLETKANIPLPQEVYLVANGTVQHQVKENATVNHVLIVYNRAGYWKALYLPKQVADSMYVKLMILDGFNLNYFEKVFEDVQPETSWVKVYKVNWNASDSVLTQASATQ